MVTHGMGPGPVVPARVPYYLLLVGDPAQISFELQYLLDVSYAVGRLHFDTADEYACYARSVVAAEVGRAGDPALGRPRRAVFFGVENEGDGVTAMVNEALMSPLCDWFGEVGPARGWEVEAILGADADKRRLGQVMSAEGAPALLFLSGHGLCLGPGEAEQRERQGALICADWTGPGEDAAEVSEEEYFAADDVPAEARLHGTIAFLCACYGGGTGRFDDFGRPVDQAPRELASHGFVARLPQRLLGHPAHGALAAIAHINRAWMSSFWWDGAGRQTAVFEVTLAALLEGQPLGAAMEWFGMRYAELATMLSHARSTRPLNHEQVVGLWTAHDDARNYLVLGDPAVRLAMGPAGRGR